MIKVDQTSFSKNDDTSLDEQVASAKQGDDEARNEMLKQYQPFIAKSVSEVCKRYIDPARDDEFSIGLLAFNEAIQSYSCDKEAPSSLSPVSLLNEKLLIISVMNRKGFP